MYFKGGNSAIILAPHKKIEETALSFVRVILLAGYKNKEQSGLMELVADEESRPSTTGTSKSDTKSGKGMGMGVGSRGKSGIPTPDKSRGSSRGRVGDSGSNGDKSREGSRGTSTGATSKAKGMDKGKQLFILYLVKVL